MRTQANLSACLRYPPYAIRHGGHPTRRSSSLASARGLSQSSETETCPFPSGRPKRNATHSPRRHASQPLPLSLRRLFSSTACTRIRLDYDDVEAAEDAFRHRRGRLGKSRTVPQDLHTLLRLSAAKEREKKRASSKNNSRLAQKDPRLLINSVKDVPQKRREKKTEKTPLPPLPSISSLDGRLIDLSRQLWDVNLARHIRLLALLQHEVGLMRLRRSKELQAKVAPLTDKSEQRASQIRWVSHEVGMMRLKRSKELQAKVAPLTDKCKQCVSQIRWAEHEYCKIAFAQTPELMAGVARVNGVLPRLYKAVVFRRWSCVTGRVPEIRHLIQKLRHVVKWEHLEPRRSARKKIDSRLKALTDTVNEYGKLRMICEPARIGLSELRLSLHDLSHIARRFFKEQKALLVTLATKTALLEHKFRMHAHHYRARWFQRRRRKHHLAEAELQALNVYSSDNLNLNPGQVVDTVALGCHANPKAARRLAKYRRSVSRRLWSLYASIERSSTPARSPGLDIRWRQLDFMAPFIICARSSWRTSNEIWYLSMTLLPSLDIWARVCLETRDKTRNNLKDWVHIFESQRREYQQVLMELTLVNSHRLKLETEMHEKGWGNDMLAGGLFVVPNPLSQDLARFQQWTYDMEAIYWDAFVAKQAMAIDRGHWERLLSKLETLETDPFKSQVPTLGSQAVQRGHRIKRHSKRKTSAAPPSQKPAQPVQRLAHDSSQDRQQQNKTKHAFARRVTEGRKRSFKTRSRPGGLRLDGEQQQQQQQPPQRTPSTLDWSPNTMARLMNIPSASLRGCGIIIYAPNLKHRLNSSQLRRAHRKLNKSPAKHSSASSKRDRDQFRVTHRLRAKVGKYMQTRAKLNEKPPLSAEDAISAPRNSAKAPPVSNKSELRTGTMEAAEATKLRKWEIGRSFTAETNTEKRRSLKSPKSTDELPVPPPGPLSPKRRPGNNAGQSRFPESQQHRRSYGTEATPCRNKTEDHASHVSVSEQSARSGSISVPLPEIATESPRASRASALPEHIASETSPSANDAASPQFWSHNSHRGPSGQSITVHYCRSLRSTEEVAQRFMESRVLGFDLEWKAQSFGSASIQNNLSLIQVANQERIALFHVALFRPARTLDDLVAPSLKRLLESPDITKVGVSIKGDSTRLRKYLGIEAKSIFELSHLFKLVKFGQTNPKLVNKRSVSLSEQVEEYFGLPLQKSDDVRCGDWTRALNHRQVQYAAADPYACVCLFHAMEIKRQAMDPMPPCPAHAELNLPIILPHGQAVNNDDKGLPISEPDENQLPFP